VTARLVGVVVDGDPTGLAAAMLEDVVDLIAGLQQVQAVLLVTPAGRGAAQRLRWPDMAIVEVPEPDGKPQALAALHAAGGEEATLVCADAPDLPPLLLGKLHSALTAAELAVVPAEGGGLVALAARLPAAAWLVQSGVELDQPDALARLRAAAPRRSLSVGAGWHRVRSRDDLTRLDPQLEGWEATRSLLGY
jgi:2-phospho-L-lactate guanylyltransferase (CobY/MobA/RfbA family)